MLRKPSRNLVIDGCQIGPDKPAYFIADIAANHDGELSRAKDLIFLAAEAGAQAAKFQHFKAATIVSEYGFRSLGSQQAHQSKWNKSIFEVYDEASVSGDWTPVLKETCQKAGITFFTSPYSKELVDAVDPYVSAFKIGSGDITWLDIIKYIARKGKPVLIATGASNLHEVQQAISTLLEETSDIGLLQCNTNYMGSVENFRYVQINVLNTYASMYPGMVLGLSDHSPGHAAVLGAVALGARVIEKHFTDDTMRTGPDHGFSLAPAAWREMVDRTREMEAALGTGEKKVEANEKETVIVQRRAIRLTHDMREGSVLTEPDLIVLRPCPLNALVPTEMAKVIGRRLRRSMKSGEHLEWTDLK